MPKTASASQILQRRIAEDPELLALVERERLNARVAQLIHDARTQANLTQRQLAELIGTRQSVISRLEDADYDGHSLSMLQRIAIALDQELTVQFIPSKTPRARRSGSSPPKAKHIS